MRVLLFALMLLAPAKALASPCYAFVKDVPGVRYAKLDIASDAGIGALAQAAPEVLIRYIAHSSYRIESPKGVSILTDYFGANGPDGPPDVVTMNQAHPSHYDDSPDPTIPFVLRGWDPTGEGPARHELKIGDVAVRNVPTALRFWGEGAEYGNSIFVFEIADLCIGHVGHLHHVPTEAQYALLGRLDVLMVPVDGSFTLDLESMIQVAKTVKSSIVLPMHMFGPASLERFIEGMRDEFAIQYLDAPVLGVSVTTLPSRPTVVVMQPAGYAWPDED